MVIRKGSIYWVDFSPGKGSEPIGRRPGLVIQNDIMKLPAVELRGILLIKR